MPEGSNRQNTAKRLIYYNGLETAFAHEHGFNSRGGDGGGQNQTNNKQDDFEKEITS
jgi:hypothetical protein